MTMEQEMKILAADLVKQAADDGIDVLAVGGAIVREDGLLLVRRAEAEEVFPNNWEIPGGSVDAGEDLLTAVAREVREEAGLETQAIKKFLGIMDFQLSDGRMVRQFNFLLAPTHYEVVLNPIEHSALEWLPINNPERLQELEMTPLMKKTIEGFLPQL